LFATPGSFAPFLLRLALSAVFFYHGAQMAFGWFGGDGWQRTVELWSSVPGVSFSYVVISAVIVAELASAAGLFFGFLTRIAGLGVFLIMGGVVYVRGGTTFDAVEYPLVLMAAGAALTFVGGGYFSVDRAISANLLPSVG
jgi:putative oxidoreductase